MLLHQFLEATARRVPAREALVCGDRRLSYADLDGESNRLAQALLARGFAPGERVAIHVSNRVEAVIAVYATLKAGGVFVLVNPEVKPRKLRELLVDAEPSALISERLPPEELPAGIRWRVALEGEAAGVSGWEAFQAEAPREQPSEQRGPDDLCSLIYTSGSTGGSKGVMLSHRNMVTATRSITEYLQLGPDDVTLNNSPLSFDYGLYNTLMPFKAGGKAILGRGFLLPGQLFGTIRREGVTGVALIPSLVSLLFRYPRLDTVQLPGVAYVTSTGEPLQPRHSRALARLFPQARLYAMYGLTECKRVSFLDPAKLARKPTSVGQAIPGTSVELLDPEGNRITSPGVTGELVVLGEHVMQGYWRQPQATARVLRVGADGRRRLHTGDLFQLDEEGDLHFVARGDDLLKVGGQRVSPRDVEALLLELDGVLEAVVRGVPDELLGTALAATLVVREGADAPGREEVLAHCQEHLERAFVPRRVEFRSSFPRTLTGKLQREVASER